MDKPFELLDHTADAKFRAYGKTREEAFAHIIPALSAILAGNQEVADKEQYHIAVKAKNIGSALFDYVDEIIFLMESEKLLPREAKGLSIVERDGEIIIDATIHGDRMANYSLSSNIKAMTYSDMLIEERPDGGWMVQVVVDI